MQKRRTFPGAIAFSFVILIGLAAAIAAGLALSGRISVITQTWEMLVATVRPLFPLEEESTPRPIEAGAPTGNAANAASAAPTVRRQTAPLSSAQLSAPLIHGPFISACGAPDEMKVVAEVTVKMGRAATVTVKSYPSDPTVAACVERAIRDLQWDVSPKTDRVTVTY